MVSGTRLRMLVAGDDYAFFEEFCRDVTPPAEIVGHARSTQEACMLAGDLSPDVVLMDLEAPAIGGSAAIGEVKNGPGQPIVFALTSTDTLIARTESFAAGADGFITKAQPEKLRVLIAMLRPYL